METKEGYPSNAHRYRTAITNRTEKSEAPERRGPLKPVAHGKEKKKTLKQVITDNFLQTSFSDIRKSVINDWIIPGSKNLIEFVIHMLLYKGEKIDPRYRSTSDRSDMRSRYLRSYENRQNASTVSPEVKITKQPEITYPSKEEAISVRNIMLSEMQDGKRASLKDLYELSNMPTDFAMSTWGWTGLTEADIEIYMLGNGEWLLRMPKAEPIQR
jgi:hypothetical protein